MAFVLKSPNGIFNKRLLRWLSPEPDETLVSFLFRLARFNFYDPPTLLHALWYERLRQQAISSDSLYYPIQPASYTILSDLTGLSPSALYQLSGHALAPILTPPHLEISSIVLPDLCQVVYVPSKIYNQQLRPAQAVTYCPLCLAESLAYPHFWLTSLVSCPRHLIVLLEGCPQCQTSLSVRDITSGHCPHCASDLTRAETHSVMEDTWGLLAQRHLHAWLGFADPAALPPLGLPDVEPRVLYAFLNGLHRCLRRRVRPHLIHQPASWPMPPLKVVPLGKSVAPRPHYCYTATAFRALTDWPHGFWAFLDGYRPDQPEEGYCDPKRQLGTLYTVYLQHLWQHPAFHFVQQAYEDYFLKHFVHKLNLMRYPHFSQSPNRPVEQTLIDGNTVQQLLQISKTTLNTWVENGTLSLVQRQPVRRFDRQQVLALQHFRQTHISLRQAAQHLNLHLSHTQQLVALGLLTPHTFPAYGRHTTWLALSEVQTLRQRLDAVLIPCASPHGLYSLTQLLGRFPTHQLTGGQLLRAVLQGELPAYCLPVSASLIRALRFDPNQLQDFLASLSI